MAQKLESRKKIRRRAALQKTLISALAILSVGGLIYFAASVGSEHGGTRAASAALARTEAPPTETAPARTPRPETTPEPTPAPPEADPDSWELRLVSANAPLGSDYQPELMEIERGERFDLRAGAYLIKLISDAREAGYDVYVCSCYRSYETQYTLYWSHVREYEQEGMTRDEAEAATRLSVNPPGGSEHQLGLAADLLEYVGQDMEPWIGGSGLMLWLEEHCADYGFIIRYPADKTAITGVEYEPWHLRYVGTCARYIMENGLCLEEFLALYES